jgi:membrane-bound serine protease (ClpP class)
MSSPLGLLWPLLALAAFLVGCGGNLRPLQEPQTAQSQKVQLLVVPVSGVLGTKELALCLRALRQAEQEGCNVAFRFEDAGGDAESLGEVQALLDQIERVRGKVGTTAIVRGAVRGGAAYAALLCDQLWFLRGGDIGSITPMPTFFEQVEQLTDESADARRFRAFRDEMRARLDRRATKLTADAARLCEGMVDPSLQLVRVRVRERGLEATRIVDQKELTGLQAAGSTILEQAAVTRPVVLTAEEAEQARIAQGTVQSVEQLCADVLGLDPKECFELEYAWIERMVSWLELFQPALLVLGLVLLILEIKTPGVGLPGLLGSAFLALALFYNYLVGLAEIPEIALFFLGIASLAVEIFVLPGVVVFGAVGFLCLVASLVLSRQTFVLPDSVPQQEILFHNLVQLTLLFVAVLVFASLMWRLLPRIPVLNRLCLPPPTPPGLAAVSPSDAAVAARIAALVGQTARAATVLRPSGAIEIEGDRYDVVTEGEFVEAGTLVRIVEVHGNRIVVERAVRDGERGSTGVLLLIAVLGVVLLVAEVFFVSFGVLTLLSGGALITAVFLAFQESQALGVAFLVGEAIVAPIALWQAFRWMPRTRLGRALMLEGPKPSEVHGAAMDSDISGLMHKRGTALSPLRPAGFARIDGKKVDVQTRGELLDQGCEIEVVETHGNRVVVRRAEPAHS